MGLFDKILGKKEVRPERGATRLGAHRPREEPVVEKDEEFVPRWQQAKKWREDKALQEPLVKRSNFKKRV